MGNKKAIEKTYLRLFKAYKKGHLSAADFRAATKEMHFTTRNGTLMRLGENAIWYKYENSKWYFDSYLSTERAREKLNVLAGYRRNPMYMRVVSIVLIITLLGAFVFDDMIRGIQREVMGLNMTYTSPEVSKTLFEGVEVKVPKGALIREEQVIQGHPLTDTQMYEMAEGTGLHCIPVYGFEFNGGLLGDEAFRKDIEIQVDLANTDVTADMYPYLEAYRVEEDGLELIPSALKGNTLSVRASRNTPILLVYALYAAGAALVGLAVNEGLHNQAMYGGVVSAYTDYTLYKLSGDAYQDYYMYYHDALAPGDIKGLKEREKAHMLRFGFVWSDDQMQYVYQNASASSQEKANRLRRATIDPAYKALQEEIHKLPIPETLKILEDRIKKAHDYLVGQRGFTNAGTVTFIVPETAGGTGLADESKVFGRSPKIVINPSIISIGHLPANEKKDILDDLLVTLTHEMFHAIQHRYYNSTLDNLWFSEATAATLEQECASYYQQKGEIGNYVSVDTNYYHLLKYKRGSSLTESQNQYVGYTLSNALIYQRDHLIPLWSRINKDNYLHYLMTQFGSDANSNAIYNIIGNADDVLKPYFESQYARILADTKELQSVKINRGQEPAKIATVSEVPFSISRYSIEVNTSNMTADEQQGSMLLFSVLEKGHDVLKNQHIRLLFSPDASHPTAAHKWTDLGNTSGIRPVETTVMATGGILGIVNEKNDYDSGSVEVSAVVATKPQKAMSVKYDQDLLAFEVELPSDSVPSNDLKRGRAIVVSVPGTSIADYYKWVEPGTNRVLIPIIEILTSDQKKPENYFSQWAGRMVEETVKASIRLGITTMTADSKGIMTSNGPLSIGFNESYSMTDDDGMTYYLGHEMKMNGFPTSYEFDVKADETLNIVLNGNTGMYMGFASKMTDYFKYYRYLKLGASAGIDYDKVAKKLKEMDGTDVYFRVRDVYSNTAVTNLEGAVKCEASKDKTHGVVLGPESDDISLFTSNLSLNMQAIPEGTYGGKLIFNISNNMYASITEQRAIYKQQRMEEEIERKFQKYMKNHPTEKDPAAVKSRIASDVAEDEAEFDQGFKEGMTEFDQKINQLYFTLTITSQSSAVLSEKDSFSYDCEIRPTGKLGVYSMIINTPEGPETAKLVLTPNGELLTDAAAVIFKK